MISYLKSLFVHPTAQQLKLQQLQETERALLMAEAELEAAHAARNMYQNRLKRLETQ